MLGRARTLLRASSISMSLRWLTVLAAAASAAEMKVDQLAADLQRARDELVAFESSSAKHLAWLRAEVEKASSSFEVEKREAAFAKREQAAFEVSDVEDSGAGQLKVTYNSGPKECTDADRVKVGDQISLRYTLKIVRSPSRAIALLSVRARRLPRCCSPIVFNGLASRTSHRPQAKRVCSLTAASSIQRLASGE